MTTTSFPALVNLAYRLKALKDAELANRLLWLAAEGRIELLADGTIGFWSNVDALLKLDVKSEARVRLPRTLAVDPTWTGPTSGAAIWGAIDPRNIEALEYNYRGVPMLRIREFTLKLRVEPEEVVAAEFAATARPRRKGPARLYPRLARSRAA